LRLPFGTTNRSTIFKDLSTMKKQTIFD